MSVSRRHFLQSAAAVSLGFSGLHRLFGERAFAATERHMVVDGFGPLIPDPHRIMDLPAGFAYRVVSWKGDPMDDGFVVPGVPDGMAAFPGPDGLTIVVRNHENSPEPVEIGPFGKDNGLLRKLAPEDLFDYGDGKRPCLGGTTTFAFDTRTGEVKGQYLSLAGTERNCAGGATPWNTWLSCEESVVGPSDGWGVDHGYVFEVPARVEPSLAAPKPIKAMGRFNHEAVAIDPKSGAVYQTEDRHDGLLYRYVPKVKDDLHQGGRLEALEVVGKPSLDTRNWDDDTVKPGERLEVRWIPMDDVEAPNDDLRERGFAAGAARFARGEGMWYGNDAVYFACTNGGKAKKGQIWRFVPSPFETTEREAEAPGVLELFVEPNDGGLIDNADNLTVAPWGDLIVCEDGSGEQYLVGVTPEGGIYKFGRNALPSQSELAGATFSPDGSTLFVNIQHDGLTLAITGPWAKRA